MWRLADPLRDERPMRLQNRLAVPAHLALSVSPPGAVAVAKCIHGSMQDILLSRLTSGEFDLR
jgi:hypothetical protein